MNKQHIIFFLIGFLISSVLFIFGWFFGFGFLNPIFSLQGIIFWFFLLVISGCIARKTGRDLWKKSASFLAGWFIPTLFPLIIIFSLIGNHALGNYMNQRSFDRNSWIQAAGSSDREKQRIWMVDDLLVTHELVGKTRQEIIGLLGEPTQTDYFSNYDMVYWLGAERSFFSIDSEWLVIKLEDNQVTEVKLVTD